MQNELTPMTRLELASQLLTATSIQILRREVRKNRDWVAIYRGFRPDSLNRPLFVRGAVAFAASPKRLAALCDVFLDSIGASKHASLGERFAAAREIDELDPALRGMCGNLASIDLPTMPLGWQVPWSGAIGPEKPDDSAEPISDDFAPIMEGSVPHTQERAPNGDTADVGNLLVL
jgi:hypothetical protein